MAFNKTEADGHITKAVGVVKEKVGHVTGNRSLEAEGEADQVVGTVQAGAGKAARKIGEAVDDVADDLNRPKRPV